MSTEERAAPKERSFKAQLLRGLKKIFREYRDLPNNDQERYLNDVTDALLKARLDQRALGRFLELMRAADLSD